MVAQPLRLLVDRVKTPIGELMVAADEMGALRAIDWSDRETGLRRLLRLHYGKDGYALTPHRDPHGLSAAMGAYFAGSLTAIDGLKVATGGTDFQRHVWRALRAIRCGTTVTYGALAQRIGRPAAVRAVGHANGANPISIVVPCHRVIGADRSLTGYGGGIARKRWLLIHEGALLADLRAA